MGVMDAMDMMTFKKTDMLEALKKNRGNHRDLFLKAQKGYEAKVIEELDRALKDAREGKRFQTMIRLEAPQDHTSDYDRIIRMLEMSVKDELLVNESQFRTYVLDDWGWKSNFITNSAQYT